MSDESVFVFATLKPKAGKADELRELLDVLLPQVREEPANMGYDLFVSGRDQPVFHFFERYASQAGIRAHRETAHFQEFSAKVGDLLDGPPEIYRMSAVDAPAQG